MAPRSLEALRTHAGSRGRRAVVLGAGEISDALDRDAGLRLAMPSVLGLRDLAPLIDREVRGRSSLDVDGAQELARVFWPTRAYERARAVLGRASVRGAHRSAGDGQDRDRSDACAGAADRRLGGARVQRSRAGVACVRRRRRQLFIADDAFGSTEYRPDAAERWARGLGRLLTMLDYRHWLIWTSRPAPLKAGLRRVQRERGCGAFPGAG